MSQARLMQEQSIKDHGPQYVGGVRSEHYPLGSPGHFGYRCEWLLDVYHDGSFRWFSAWSNGYATGQLDALKSGGCGDTPLPGQCELLLANPINIASGIKYQQDSDIADQSGGLSLTRFFIGDNVDRPAAIFGEVWRSNYDRHIVLWDSIGIQTAVIYRPDGKGLYFNKMDDNWRADSDVQFKLTQLGPSGSISGWDLTDPHDTHEIYDANGRLQQIVFKDRRKLVLEYTIGGQLMRVTDRHGRRLSFSYNAEGRLSAVIDPASQRFEYGYAAGGVLTEVRYPDGHVKTYKYNENDYVAAAGSPGSYLTGIEEDGSRYASFYYDAQGRARISTHANAIDRVEFSYLDENTVRVTDSLGAVSTRSLQLGNGYKRFVGASALSSIDGNRAAAISYDARGYPDGFRDFSGNMRDSDYDARGLMSRQTEAANDSTGSKRSILTSWHPNFRVPVEKVIHDANDSLLSRYTWTYNARGQALTSSRTDPVAGTTRITTTTYCEQTEIDAGTCPLSGLTTSVDGPRSDLSDLLRYTYYATDDASCAATPTT
ncbi:DUF6531 domain-containing protein, partial [Xanthomonas dyei]|uniref:DUF6531 domain-containing protein n=1 Tax=Xanthomonas dyei TaxID=743699 RepID=UPI001E4150D2